MKKINFEEITMFLDVAHTRQVTQNVRTSFADIIYSFGTGVACHALALKIYNSKGEKEYNEEECELIQRFAEKCTPAFIDAINDLLK